MTLIKTSILSFIAIAIKILTGLVINKAISLYIGPTGLALIGQFQNFSQLVITAAQGAINTGVTKYTAEYGSNNNKIPILFSTAIKISLFFSVAIGFGIAIFSKNASIFLLKSNSYNYIFLIFGFTIIFSVINSLLLSILNGLKEIKIWVYINIIQSIYSLAFTTLLIIWLGLEGALIALVTNQSITLVIIVWMLKNHPMINISNFKQTFDRAEAKKLFGFAAMAITSATTMPISHLIIRNYIGENLGWEQAGYWQAMWYISTMYLTLVTTTLSIYYLPRLSEVNSKMEIKKELYKGYKLFIPIISVISLIIYFLRDFIILILFSKDFYLIKDLFFWQLVGDIIKLASWLASYLLIAKAIIPPFIIAEIFFSLSFTIISIFLVDKFGLLGMSYSHTINYSLYLITILLIVSKTIFK